MSVSMARPRTHDEGWKKIVRRLEDAISQKETSAS